MAIMEGNRFCEKGSFKTRVENALRNVTNMSRIKIMMMEKSWLMMMHQTDKKHEE